MTIVVQGFEPFDGHAINPSQRLVSALAAEERDGIFARVLPTSRARVQEAVPALMAEHRPTAWIGVGLADGRRVLSLEAAALNLLDWRRPDADGHVVRRAPIVPGGSPAQLTTLPVQSILEAWRADGIPGTLSLTAGSYICNLSFYLAARSAADLGLACRVGFIHVPMLPEMAATVDEPSMAMELLTRGLDLALRATSAADADEGLYEAGAA